MPMQDLSHEPDRSWYLEAYIDRVLSDKDSRPFSGTRYDAKQEREVHEKELKAKYVWSTIEVILVQL